MFVEPVCYICQIYIKFTFDFVKRGRWIINKSVISIKRHFTRRGTLWEIVKKQDKKKWAQDKKWTQDTTLRNTNWNTHHRELLFPIIVTVDLLDKQDRNQFTALFHIPKLDNLRINSSCMIDSVKSFAPVKKSRSSDLTWIHGAKDFIRKTNNAESVYKEQ